MILSKILLEAIDRDNSYQDALKIFNTLSDEEKWDVCPKSGFLKNVPTLLYRHVIKGKAKAKFTIAPVRLVENHGLKPAEIKLVESVIEENVEVIAEHWNRYFNNSVNIHEDRENMAD